MIVPQIIRLYRKCNLHTLPGFDVDFPECPQLFLRLENPGAWSTDIKLYNLSAVPQPRILHHAGDPEPLFCLFDLHLSVVECRVGQAVSKRKPHPLPCCQVIAVPYIHAFSVYLADLLSERSGKRNILIRDGPCLRQTSGRTGISVKQPHCGSASVLPGKEHVQDRLYLIRKRKFHSRAAKEHDHDLLSGLCKRPDQLQLVLRQAHIRPVTSLALYMIRKPREYQHCIISLSALYSLPDHPKICFCSILSVPRNIFI